MNEYLEKWCCLLIFINNNDVSSIHNNISAEKQLDMVKHTRQITNDLACTKYIYYNGHINESDAWQEKTMTFVAEGDDKVLQRLQAFEFAFSNGFRKIILIENDTTELQTKHLLEAFNCLKMIEFCIGPEKFVGYYLLGMNYYEPALFVNMQLDSPSFLKDCVNKIGKVRKMLYKLPVLADKTADGKSQSFLKKHPGL